MNGVGKNPKFFYSFPNSPYHTSPNLPAGASATASVSSIEHTDDEGGDDVLEFPARRHFTQPTSTKWQSRRRRFRRRVTKIFKSFYEFMTVPLWAALLSLIVACIPPLQHALDEHVQPIKGALNQAGNCSIPLTLVVLGAYFYSPPDPEAARSRAALPSTRARGRSLSTTWSQLSLVDNVREMFKMRKRSPSRAAQTSKEKRPGETKTVVIAVLARMVITPLLLLPVLALSTEFDLQEVFDEYVHASYSRLLNHSSLAQPGIRCVERAADCVSAGSNIGSGKHFSGYDGDFLSCPLSRSPKQHPATPSSASSVGQSSGRTASSHRPRRSLSSSSGSFSPNYDPPRAVPCRDRPHSCIACNVLAFCSHVSHHLPSIHDAPCSSRFLDYC